MSTDSSVAAQQPFMMQPDLVALELLFGTFYGGFCADKTKRRREQDFGWGYDENHPVVAGEVVLVSPAESARLLRPAGSKQTANGPQPVYQFKKHEPAAT